MSNKPTPEQPFLELVKVMHRLRAPGGCPWDREQTHESLLPFLAEETQELVEAIEEKEYAKIRDELGDVLLQVVFHAELAEEAGHFSIWEVVNTLRDKLVRRHPHVFGDLKNVKSADDVKAVWKQAKNKEGKRSLLDGIPKGMPALQRAWRISDRAATSGFDWERLDQVWEKMHEEIGELAEAISSEDQEAMIDELGDIMFSVVNVGRFLNVDAETALRRCNQRFIQRFKHMEEELEREGKDLNDLPVDALEQRWQRAKQRISP